MIQVQSEGRREEKRERGKEGKKATTNNIR